MDRLLESHELLQQLEAPFTAEALFDLMPDIVFFIKDASGRYLVANQTLVERSGKNDKSEVIGRTPAELLGAALGRSFEAQDQDVLRTGRPLTDLLELHVSRSRTTGWCLTNKLPLTNSVGGVIGLVGVSRDLRLPDMTGDDFEHISAAVHYAESHLAESPGNNTLARVAGMSPYQLDRRMKRVYGLTTGQWLLKTRISEAQRLLVETDAPIAAIALDVGYGDQSAFTKQFRRATGVPPSVFRRMRRA